MNVGCQPGVSLKFTMHDRIEKRRKLSYSLDFAISGLIVFYLYIFGVFFKVYSDEELWLGLAYT